MNERDEETPVSKGDPELLAWLRDHVQRTPGLTTLKLSRSTSIGWSRTSLDAYIDGRYFSPIAEGGFGVDPRTSGLERAVAAYRERVMRRQHKGVAAHV